MQSSPTQRRSDRKRPSANAEHEGRRERDRRRLEEATRALQDSEGWRRWIALRRHNGLARYSTTNQLLLACEAWARGTELNYVAGYRWWSEHGYQVRRGERGYAIMAPLARWIEDEGTGERVRRIVGFRSVSVFDRSQVEAGPDAVAIEPPQAEPLSGDSHAHLLPKLRGFADSIGVRVDIESVPGAARGFYRRRDSRIVVAPDDPNAMVRTLLHELAHALLAERGGGDSVGGRVALDYAEEECVVECAGHVAAAAAGLDTSGEAVAYCAGWGEDGKLEVVAEAARLIDALAARLEAAMGLDESSGTD
ncbi:MAG: hypothetical protein BroJett022_14210 [Actinomycetes bacterium]|nr:MAG: hypothetical protein BroJett022_14210 [Actinomycetes bacterium]